MNYRKYILSGMAQYLVAIKDANDAQIYNKLNYILYKADIFYRESPPYTIYDGDNMKKLYAMNPQFRTLLHEAETRNDIKFETLIQEILERLK